MNTLPGPGPGDRFVQGVKDLGTILFAGLLILTLASPVVALVGYLIFG